MEQRGSSHRFSCSQSWKRRVDGLRRSSCGSGYPPAFCSSERNRLVFERLSHSYDRAAAGMTSFVLAATEAGGPVYKLAP